MTRILISLALLTALASAAASAQSVLSSLRDSTATDTSVGVAVSGDIALAGLLAPVRLQPIRAPAVEHSGVGLSACAGRGQWKCILGGAAIGFVAGALIGQAFIPKEVEHSEYGCGFFDCGSYTVCDAHCDEPVTKIWAFGAGGAVLGGMGGYYLAKASTR